MLRGMTDDPARSLAGAHYLLLVTFRKNGDGVPTPVWFGERDGRLYMRTLAGSPKTQRIRNREHVEVAPCEADGKPLAARVRGTARLLETNDPLLPKLDVQLDARYGEERLAMTRAVRDEQGLPLEWIEVVLDLPATAN
jgi:PPOX class probable F420-dependent enzyme